MAENNIKETVIGVAYDGTGYGDDDNVWGGEFLICDLKRYSRVGHLKYCSLPGGDKAIVEPWRMAYSYLYSIYNENARELPLDFMRRNASRRFDLLEKMINQQINTPLTSSCGRLFDAVSSLIGVRDKISYEGQAAVEMEALCREGIEEGYNFRIEREGQLFLIAPEDIFREIITDLKKGVNPATIATKFHNTVANFTIELCVKIREETHLNQVALSGGVFQNRYLSERIIHQLTEKDFKVYFQRKVPPNDGGISLGQAVIAGSQ